MPRAAIVLVTIALACILAAPIALAGEEFPSWAFPSPPAAASTSAAPASQSAAVLLSVPGSSVRLRAADLVNISRPPDWFPAEHPAAPVPVGAARAPGLWACGFCHLPNGQGRPENASLAGLPSAYILTQISAFRSGERHGAKPDWKPSTLMSAIARDATDEDIARAADYFSQRPFASHVEVVESRTVPAHAPLGFIHAPTQGATMVSLGDEIIEMPTDTTRFERRDPNSRFVAYVPVGSRARGARLARDGAPACSTCHGAGLRGGAGAIAPPIAGRSPSYLFRQLFGFRSGDRVGTAAQPMRAIAATLSRADMIALAAYAASLPP